MGASDDFMADVGKTPPAQKASSLFAKDVSLQPASIQQPVGNAANGGVAAGVKQGFMDVPSGVSQVGYHVASPRAQGWLDALDNWAYQKTGGVIGSPEKTFDQTLAKENSQYEADRKAAGREGMDWARVGGNILPSTVATIASGGAAGPATFGAALRGGALAGALSGAAAPVTNGGQDFWSDKGKQTATGAAAGALGTVAARGLAAVLDPAISGAQKILRDSDVAMTLGQYLGGGFKRAEDAMTSVPVLGDLIKNAQRRSFESLDAAAINRSLAPIGDKLPAGTAGRDAISYAESSISKAYNDALSKVGSVRPDAQFAADMQNLAQLTQNLPKSMGDQFLSILRNEVASRMQGGAITGEGFKAAESNLGNIARSYVRSPDADQRVLGQAIQQAQTNLRSMLQRAAPPDVSQGIANANAAFANFLRPQRAASMVGAEGGIFTPEQLASAVKALDPSKRNSSYAAGRALMQDLSDSAKSVMGNKVPDSGTPLRSAMMLGGAGLLGHAALPAAATGGTAPLAAALLGGTAALPYTPLGQRATQLFMAERPQQLQLLAEALRRSAVPIAAGTPALVKSGE